MRHVLLILLLLYATAASAVEIRVFAAASLTEPLNELAAKYEAATGDDVLFHFGGSNLLARQIERGAPVDAFFSADERTMDALAAQNLVRNVTRVSFLSNSLVVVVSKDVGARIASAQDLETHSVALGEPSTVPAGVYARLYLEKLNLWRAIAPRVIPTDNVRAALGAVAAGNADAAIVYATDARISSRVRVAFALPRPAGAPVISYPFAVLRGAEQPKAAERFLSFLRSETARQTFARYGFVLQ